MTSFVAAALAFSSALVSAHIDYKLEVRDQFRGGDEHIASQKPPNTQTMSEIVAPGAQIHATFGNDQDLMLHYRAQWMDTYISNGATDGIHGAWTGFSLLHRGTVIYSVGDAHTLRLTSTFNASVGKLDAIQADTLVEGSGLSPGRTGQTLNYTSYVLVLGVERIVLRSWHIATTNTLSYVDFPGGSQTADFENNPGLVPAPQSTSNIQFKALSRNQLTYDFTAKKSANFALELSDVSYEATSTYFGVAPTIGFKNNWTSLSSVIVRAGAMHYWANPYPGIVMAPKWLAVLELTLDHTFTDWGLPKLKGNLKLSVLPFYNLQFSDLEPRTTLTAQLNYKWSPKWSTILGIRAFTSEYWDFHSLIRLQRGHPRNIGIVSLTLQYNPNKWIAVTGGGYVSERTFVQGVQQPYNLLQEFYGLVGVTGTWQVN